MQGCIYQLIEQLYVYDGQIPLEAQTNSDLLQHLRHSCYVKAAELKHLGFICDIDTNTDRHSKSTRDKVLDASKKRMDDIVLHCMLTNPDLFAAHAKCHRTCYQSYISTRNISAAQRKSAEPDKTSFDKALDDLVDSLHRTVFSKDMAVTDLAHIKTDDVEKLTEFEVEDPQSCSSWKLKQRLVNHFGGKFVFIEKSGRSDLVCSIVMMVGDALQKAFYLIQV